MEIKKKSIFFSGVFCFFAGLSFYLFRRWKKSQLLHRHYERFRELKELYEKTKNLTDEISYGIFNLVNDIADYFYFRDHAYEEELRSECLDSHEEEYEHLCYDSMENHHQAMEKAQKYVISLLGVEFKAVREYINKHRDNYRDNMLKYRQRSDNVPNVDKDTCKKAYIFYADEMIKSNRMSLMLQSTPQANQGEVIRGIIVSQCQTKDRLKNNFGVEERFLIDHLDIHQLREDPEVKVKIEMLKKLDDQRFAMQAKKNEEEYEEGEADH